MIVQRIRRIIAEPTGRAISFASLSLSGSRVMKKAIAVVTLIAFALATNTFWVDSATRPAAARDGGQLVETPLVTANVKVEGSGPPIVFIHGFGAAIDWWDDIAPDLAKDHRTIRIDLIGHGGTAAP